MALRAFALALAAWAVLGCPSLGADLVPLKAAGAGVAAPDDDNAFDVETTAFLMSDYIYRGVSLSQRKPSAGMSVEATWYKFYAGVNVQSVDLPTQPASEVTWFGGYRRTIGDVDLDLGASYFWYPGEIVADGQPRTSYWEYAFKVAVPLVGQALGSPRLVNLTGQLAYSPNLSGTGAWGTYAEAGVEIDLSPWPILPGIDWQFHASAGYWRFGSTSPVLGGLPLPAYANWLVGLEFSYQDHLLLDLSYADTNLAKEDCFIFTGDPMATPGGVANPITNPDGLRSRLCGAAFVATLTARFDLSDLK
jgi:uncharacterized protein (TIGR02001 family)